MKKRKTPRQKEIELLEKQESHFLESRQKQKDSKLNELLIDKVPDKLQNALEKAFSKAFGLIFQKGAGIIEKTYNKEEMEKDFKVLDYTNRVKSDRKSLRTMRNNAKNAGKVNTFASALTGVGMGVIGVGIPDIPVFTSFLLRSIYQISLKYGYSYDTPEERKWILLLIKGAVTYGKEQQATDWQLNEFIKEERFVPDLSEKDLINETAKALSKELLYMKFLQGIPIVGAVGGVYDFKYMKEITTYAEIKYRKRYYAAETISE